MSDTWTSLTQVLGIFHLQRLSQVFLETNHQKDVHKNHALVLTAWLWPSAHGPSIFRKDHPDDGISPGLQVADGKSVQKNWDVFEMYPYTPYIYIPQIWSNHNHFSGLQFWHEIWLMFKSPLCGSILILMGISTDYKHITSMVLLYMVLHGSHQYTPFMLALIYQHQPDPSWVMFLFISANPYFLHGHHGWLPMLHDFDPKVLTLCCLIPLLARFLTQSLGRGIYTWWIIISGSQLVSKWGYIICYNMLYPGWWFQAWIFWLSIQLGTIIPFDFHIFQMGRYTTNQQPTYVG